jgi:hypothetical protein
MQWQKGQSGNPAGRPKGSRNRSTLLVEAMLDGEAEAVIQAVIDKAKEGDTMAQRLCLDRMAPRLRARESVPAFELPPLNSVADMMPALAGGELSAGEAGKLSKLIDKWVRVLESAELAERFRKIKERYEREEQEAQQQEASQE